MALRRVLLEMGMGTDLHGRDYAKAAQRAVRDALWHNSLSFAGAVGQGPEAMQVEVTIGVPRPGEVDQDAVLQVLPYGERRIKVVPGGLEVPTESGQDATVIANAAVVVSLDL